MTLKVISKTVLLFLLFLLAQTITYGDELASFSASVEPDPAGNTPLHYAAQNGDVSLIPELVVLDFEQKNLLGETPLHCAILHGKQEALELLLKYGANPNNPIELGIGKKKISITPLQLAILRGAKGCLDVLIQTKQTSLKEESSYFGNPLHIAVEFSQPEMLQHLFDQYGEEIAPFLEGKNTKGQTPFSLASGLGCIDCMGVLKNLRVNIEAEDYLRQRPIHHAAINEQSNAIKYLAFLGAELEPRDANRRTPEDLSSNPQIKNLLINLSKIGEQVKKLPPNFESSPPKNLVFKGGGAKGLCYVGAIQALEKNDHLGEVLRVAGTSAGAISATFLAMGYSAGEILHLSNEMNFEAFLDHPLSKKKISEAMNHASIGKIVSGIWKVYETIRHPVVAVVDAIKKLWHTTGICEGEEARKWFEQSIREKTKDAQHPEGIPYFTFGDLRRAIEMGKPYLHLHIFATKIGQTPEIVHFSSEDPLFDEVIISDALTASMSIPGVFTPHVLHIKVKDDRIAWPEGGQFLDGGMLYNFPIEAFDFTEYQVALEKGSEVKGEPKFNRQTLGFNLYSSIAMQKKNEDKSVETVGDLLKSVASIYFSSEEILRELVPYNKHRVIEIDVLDVGTLDFKLPHDKQEMLVASGRTAVQNFFRKSQLDKLDIFTPFHRLALKKKNRLSVPEPTPQFIGRKKELDTLALELSIKEVNPQTPSTFKILTGQKGIGKSELTYAFVDNNLANYSLAWEIECSNQSAFMEDYKKLAQALDLPTDDPDEIVSEVNIALENWKSLEKPYLLIFKNLNERIPMPKTGGTILITTTDLNVHDKESSLSLSSMGETESTAMLSALTDRPITQDMKDLARFLDYSPLLLTLSGKYVKYTETSFTDYINHLNEASDHPHNDVDSHEQLLYKVLVMSMKELERTDSVAYEIFSYSPFVYSSDISFGVLKEWLDKEYKKVKLDQVLMHLQAFSLVRSSKEGGLYIHRRLAKCMEHLMDQKQKEDRYSRLGKSLSAMVSSQVKDNSVFEWDKNLFKQAAAFLEHPLRTTLKKEVLSTLSEHVASFQFHVLGDIHSALQITKEMEASLDQDQVERTPFMLISAKCLKVLGKPEEGLEKLRSALKIHEKRGSSKKLLIAEIYNEIGNCYKAMDNPEEAIKNHNYALGIRLDKHNKGHPDIAASINNIANCLKDLGKLEEAKTEHKKARDIYINFYGNSHPIVARSLNNIGNCYRLQQNPEKAMHYLKKARTILESSLGENHPDLATCLSNIGDCYLLMDKKEDARANYEKAYKIAEVSLGKNHFLTKKYKSQMEN